VAVIYKILGVPLNEPTFHGWIDPWRERIWADAKLRKGGSVSHRPRGIAAALTQYISDLIDGYVEKPGEGLLSKLVNDNDGPDGAMASKEATANAMLLLVAGHDSTVNTISNCVMTLVRNPGSLELLRAKP
jgi:cytochrome P450